MKALAIILIVFFSLPALADPDPCDLVPNSFAKLVDRANLGVKFLTKEQAAERVEALSKIEVKEIFPETKQIRTGRRITETRVRDDAAAVDRYKRHFDELWESRVKAGQIPSWYLKQYREWLLKMSKTNPPGAYPEIKAKELFEDYVSDGGTLNEYLDFQYLDYLESTRAIRPESVDAYLQSLDKSFLRHLGRASIRKAKSIASSAWGGAIGASVLMLATLPGEVAGAFLTPILQPMKDFLKNEAREASTQAVEAVKDWGNLFVGGEEGYLTALMNLNFLTSQFDQKNFDKMNRAEVAKAFDEYTKQTSKILPQFHKLVMAEQKDFEEKWDQRLKDFRDPILQMSSTFELHKDAVDRIQSDISEKGGVATPEQLEKLAEESKKMRVVEEYIANILADWLFYKQARGADKPLEAGLDKNFSTAYDLYLINKDPALLAKAMNERVKAHVRQLRQYSDKAQGKEVQPITNQPKPEDQIKVDSGSTVVPASKNGR